MKKKAIKLAAAVLCLIFIFPQKVWGADINVTYQTEETAKAGDKVTVEVDVSGSKPITTLGLRLAYDSTKLTYESESWSESAENANAMTLVSDVESDEGKVLNISMISDAGYQGSGTMVTLTFSVKEDYTDVPVELTLRDITDKDMQDVSAATNVSYQKQEGNNNQNNENNEDNNDNQNNENNNDSQNSGSGGENSNNSGSHTDSANEGSHVYRTGIEIMDFKLLAIGGIFLAAGIFCFILKKKLSR